MSRSRIHLRLEPLENRVVPYGTPWPDAQHLTLSFLPDGTAIEGGESNLFQFLNAQGTPSDWQLEILRAFQTWAVEANINVGLVADGGQTLGVTGATQRDDRFGDIRVGAWDDMDEVQVSAASPFEWNGTTWSGDVLLNSEMNSGIGAGAAYDLFTVLLHEAGHVLGLDHSDAVSSIMFEDYVGIRGGLSAADIADLRSIYGARLHDAFDRGASNNSFSSASNIGTGAAQRDFEADITTTSDVDYYKIKTPLLGLGFTGFRVSLKTSGLSPLVSSVSVYDSNRNHIQTVTATDALHGDIYVHVPTTQLNRTFYVRVDNAVSDVFGVGAYRTNIAYYYANGYVDEGDSGPLFIDDFHTNDLLSTATNLLPIWGNTADSRFDYLYRGVVRDSWDKDFYLVRSPAASGLTMTTLVWQNDSSNLQPAVHIYNLLLQPVAVDVVTNAAGMYVIQVPNCAANSVYFIDVGAADTTGPNHTGRYTMATDFNTACIVTLSKMGSNTLTQSFQTDESEIDAREAKLFHFLLGSRSNSGFTDAFVRMTIVNRRGDVVATLDSKPDRPATTLSIYVPEGTYTIRFRAIKPNGSFNGSLTYWLDAEMLSDSVGPYYSGGTSSGGGSGNGGYSYSGSSSSNTNYNRPYYY